MWSEKRVKGFYVLSRAGIEPATDGCLVYFSMWSIRYTDLFYYSIYVPFQYRLQSTALPTELSRAISIAHTEPFIHTQYTRATNMPNTQIKRYKDTEDWIHFQINQNDQTNRDHLNMSISHPLMIADLATLQYIIGHADLTLITLPLSLLWIHWLKQSLSSSHCCILIGHSSMKHMIHFHSWPD